MNPKQKLLGATLRCLLAIVCTIALVPGDTLAYMLPSPSGRASSPQDEAAKIPNDSESFATSIRARFRWSRSEISNPFGKRNWQN